MQLLTCVLLAHSPKSLPQSGTANFAIPFSSLLFMITVCCQATPISHPNLFKLCPFFPHIQYLINLLSFLPTADH